MRTQEKEASTPCRYRKGELSTQVSTPRMEACWVAARTETAQEGARKMALGGQVRGEQDFVGCGFLQSDVMWEAITES